MNKKNPFLTIENLSVRRGNFLLDSISLAVEQDEILAILGKTGSGKSMLLESIAGFYRPAQGNVYLNETAVYDMDITKRRIGYLYQDYSLFPHMTAEKNIAYGLKMQCLPQSEIMEQVYKMAERFEIKHIMKQYPATLSGGEQQRVALARALAVRPSVLLLDEPFSALDPVTKRKMYGILKDIRKDFACPVIFVTHDFDEARELADNIGILDSGHLHGVVPADELYSHGWSADICRLLGIG